ncbi:hypothetical protein ACA910_018854 [Epithemia clementina (nom. ined.)]
MHHRHTISSSTNTNGTEDTEENSDGDDDLPLLEAATDPSTDTTIHNRIPLDIASSTSSTSSHHHGAQYLRKKYSIIHGGASTFFKRLGRLTRNQRDVLPCSHGEKNVETQPLTNNNGHHHHHAHDDDENNNDNKEASEAPSTTKIPSIQVLPKSVQLMIGTIGIYSTYLYVGSLLEDVFLYTSPDDGTMFNQAWFLQMVESLACMSVGFLGILWSGLTFGLPLRMFWWSGAAQVSAKAYSNLALAHGLNYPTMVLAKSAKMAPVMIGSMVVGGASYESREYLQVLAIIIGTMMVSFSKPSSSSTIVLTTTTPAAGELVDPAATDSMGGLLASSSSSSVSVLAVVYILVSLIFDGVVGGFQKRLKMETAQVGTTPTPADFMFWFSVPMTLISGFITVAQGDFTSTLEFCLANPELQGKIIRYSLCSALGSVFVFYTLAHFDPLVVSTVTTTRKIFSVFLSIFLKGHSMSLSGWLGIALACGGILSELNAKRRQHNHRQQQANKQLWSGNAKHISFRSTFGNN